MGRNVFLNTASKGIASKGRTPICAWKWGHYFTKGHGNDCPTNYVSVLDEANCRKAAHALKLDSFEQTDAFEGKPGGCFANAQGRVFLNTGKGVAHEDHTPLCEWQYHDPQAEMNQSSQESSLLAITVEEPQDDEDEAFEKEDAE